MGIPAKDIPENRNKTRTRTSAVSTSGPSHMVAVGGARRGSRPKQPVLSRYLRPKIASCHDSCKQNVNDGGPEIKRPARRMGSRKTSFNKNKGVKRSVEPVERKKMTKTKPKRSPEQRTRAPDEPVEIIKPEKVLPSKKVGVFKHGSPTYRKVTQKDLKMPKSRPTNVKTKAVSSSAVNASSQLNGQKTAKDIKTNKQTPMVPKSTSVENPKHMSPVKDQNTEKVEEMTLQEAETAELEFVTPTTEIIRSPTSESTDLLNSENTQSSSDKQVSNLESEHEHNADEVLEEECENTNDKEVIVDEDDYEMENSNYRVVDCEDEEDEGMEVKFRRGRVIEPESDDNSPRKLKFRRGTILDNNGNHESEAVTLKHQEQKEKEAQELLNRLIEEKASKLAEDRKTKVGALVGAFETVISLKDDMPPSES